MTVTALTWWWWWWGGCGQQATGSIVRRHLAGVYSGSDVPRARSTRGRPARPHAIPYAPPRFTPHLAAPRPPLATPRPRPLRPGSLLLGVEPPPRRQINTASRMESTSAPGRIQCTRRTADLVLAQDPGAARLVRRGEVEVKVSARGPPDGGRPARGPARGARCCAQASRRGVAGGRVTCTLLLPSDRGRRRVRRVDLWEALGSGDSLRLARARAHAHSTG